MSVEIRDLELQAVHEALDLNIGALEDFLEEHEYSSSERIRIQDTLAWSKQVKERIEKELNKFQRRALEVRREAVSKEFLELRDAKSNGCLVGKSWPEILAYDSKLEELGNTLRQMSEEIKKLY